MTATDELRRMLDERGVEWACVDLMTGEERPNLTEWNVLDGGWVEATEIAGHITYVWWMGEKFTPEQAIEATLGRGTCSCTTPDGTWCFVCSECGKSFPRSDLHFAHSHGEINFCPNCGRKVVDE